ncbi:bromodomain containing [Seminavis robusta]|uniref:Bromodomain containing n=1 Tax=Seminavis robusta TaxID=568900 RepID=A0A9N8E4W4_9STRA|nr:bromodomain containing [Seminavis robusta]|eukprot:Sro622_g176940.1 bromodomain containing (198) ;mRNA; f:20362-20955
MPKRVPTAVSRGDESAMKKKKKTCCVELGANLLTCAPHVGIFRGNHLVDFLGPADMLRLFQMKECVHAFGLADEFCSRHGRRFLPTQPQQCPECRACTSCDRLDTEGIHENSSRREIGTFYCQDCKPLSPREQEALTEAVNNMSGDRISGVIQIIREAVTIDDEDEIDLEIDQLPAPTQRKMFKYAFPGGKASTAEE